MRFLSRLLGAKLLIARLWLVLERFWLALWPAVMWIGAYTAASLFDPWAEVPPWVRTVTLLGVLAVAVAQGFRALRQISLPDDSDARRHLEAATGLRHRPLDILDDESAGSRSPRSEALWRTHKSRMRVSPLNVRIGFPRAGLQRRDPQAIRVLLVLVFMTGLMHAGADWSRRVTNAFSLDLSASRSEALLDAWLNPPDYTGVNPIALALAGQYPGAPGKEASKYVMPEGTTFSLRVDADSPTPRLEIGDREAAIANDESGTYSAEVTLLESDTIEVSSGGLHKSWRITIVPDKPPTVSFANAPDETGRHALRVRYLLNDDYGVSETVLNIANPGARTDDNISLSLPGASTIDGEVGRTAYQDLTAHPWAGTQVTAILTARDALGQSTDSAPVQFVMPERLFTHAVARRLVAIRKTLYQNPEDREGPARRLSTMSRRPADFDGDLAVFTALRTAYWRLRWNEDEESLRQVMSLLWDTALHLEEGETSLAEQALRNLMEEAQQALSEGADGQSFSDLVDQMGRLIQEYLSSQHSRAEELPRFEGAGMQTVGSDMLQRMLQQMKDLAAAGRTEEAMGILETLREMMENAAPAQMNGEAYRQMMENAQALNDLEDLARSQQDLMNRTAREGMLNAMRQRLGGQNSELSDLSAEQGELGAKVRGLEQSLAQKGLGQSGQLGQAGTAMEQATSALAKSDGDGALTSQANALTALQDAIEQMGAQLSQQMMQLGQSAPGGDPLGRSTGAVQDRIEIPDASEMEDVRRLLNELRERLSDPARTEEEIEYLRRLLQRF